MASPQRLSPLPWNCKEGQGSTTNTWCSGRPCGTISHPHASRLHLCFVSFSSESEIARMGRPSISGFRPRRLPCVPGHIAAFALVVSVLTLSGCGVRTATSQSSAASATNPAATSAPTSTGATIHDTASNACPLAQAPEDATSFTPDIIVSGDGGPIHTVSLRRSQRLEIRLDPQIQWTLRVDDLNHTLVGARSQGWHDPKSNTCVWRFTAQAAGDAQLVFTGTQPCPPLKFCPSSDRSATYRLTVA
jgi:hypothetical protein